MYTLFLNSDQSINQNLDQPTYQINKPYSATSYSILRASIPLSYYVINDSNNTLGYSLYEDSNTPSTITIPNGDYTSASSGSSSISTLLTSLLSTATSKTITATYNIVDQKITITQTPDSTIEVNDSNNVIDFALSADYTTHYTATITPGFYTSSTILTAIKSAMELADVANTFTITYGSKISIEINADDFKIFKASTTASSWLKITADLTSTSSVAQVQSNTIFLNNANFTILYGTSTCQDWLGSSKTADQTSVAGILEFDNILDLSGMSSIYLECQRLSGTNNEFVGAIQHSSIILDIPVDSGSGNYLQYSPNFEQRASCNGQIDSLSFTLRDNKTLQPLKLNGLPWSIVIRLYDELDD